MNRSRFEQMIDAGLAHREPTRSRNDTDLSRAFRPATKQANKSDFLQMRQENEPGGSLHKPHLSAHDLRKAYRDWQMVFADFDEDLEPHEADTEPGTPEQQQQIPDLPELLNQLANHKQMTRSQLQTLRRQLARHIHPDIVSEDHRQSATAEMAKLNALLDAALRAHGRQ
ncbi:protein of unknown function [Candidatus Filomicrobium marinum]|uniref:Uncharacterized protein n=2 Tax=Filomicrobium TaxID=119044 RepID=A0A0D6JJL3_9HYPH|nr:MULTISPECIES: hypothetical protein [Filomicrobium]CFX55122.1 protein of unknown function [Candidatus Filomicrobium marinum]CPR22174.1 protein of unknown function [Candidatus Filomicrobium marinum]SDO94049.1 hypothetical protein SAMN04488061_2050 [Filomicrobium insigne]